MWKMKRDYVFNTGNDKGFLNYLLSRNRNSNVLSIHYVRNSDFFLLFMCMCVRESDFVNTPKCTWRNARTEWWSITGIATYVIDERSDTRDIYHRRGDNSVIAHVSIFLTSAICYLQGSLNAFHRMDETRSRKSSLSVPFGWSPRFPLVLFNYRIRGVIFSPPAFSMQYFWYVCMYFRGLRSPGGGDVTFALPHRRREPYSSRLFRKWPESIYL